MKASAAGREACAIRPPLVLEKSSLTGVSPILSGGGKGKMGGGRTGVCFRPGGTAETSATFNLPLGLKALTRDT